MYLATSLPADGLLLLTMLIKPYYSTNKAKGLSMDIKDGERMARIVRYDLCVSDYLHGLQRSSSISLKGRASKQHVSVT